MGCSFYVYYKGNHIGGGPIFIDYIFSKKEFLEEHKDCKSVLEVCSGPGFIGWYLYKTLNMDSVHFLDIHKPVEDDLKMTCEINNEELNFYHSDGFKNYDGPKVDLIVMNPPFYYTKKQFDNHKKYFELTTDKQIENAKRITLDLDFKLHDNLISNFKKHLTDNGRIVFLEDLNFISRDFMESKIDENKSGEYKEFCVGREYIGADGKRKQRPENTIYEEPNTPNYYTLTYYKQTT